MAKQNFLAGGYYGKLGQTVGQRWKNKRTIRTYVIPHNPRTPEQQANRNKFGQAVPMAQLAMAANWKSRAFYEADNTEWAIRMKTAKLSFDFGKEGLDLVPLFPFHLSEIDGEKVLNPNDTLKHITSVFYGGVQNGKGVLQITGQNLVVSQEYCVLLMFKEGARQGEIIMGWGAARDDDPLTVDFTIENFADIGADKMSVRLGSLNEGVGNQSVLCVATDLQVDDAPDFEFAFTQGQITSDELGNWIIDFNVTSDMPETATFVMGGNKPSGYCYTKLEAAKHFKRAADGVRTSFNGLDFTLVSQELIPAQKKIRVKIAAPNPQVYDFYNFDATGMPFVFENVGASGYNAINVEASINWQSAPNRVQPLVPYGIANGTTIQSFDGFQKIATRHWQAKFTLNMPNLPENLQGWSSLFDYDGTLLAFDELNEGAIATFGGTEYDWGDFDDASAITMSISQFGNKQATAFLTIEGNSIPTSNLTAFWIDGYFESNIGFLWNTEYAVTGENPRLQDFGEFEAEIDVP